LLLQVRSMDDCSAKNWHKSGSNKRPLMNWWQVMNQSAFDISNSDSLFSTWSTSQITGVSLVSFSWMWWIFYTRYFFTCFCCLTILFTIIFFLLFCCSLSADTTWGCIWGVMLSSFSCFSLLVSKLEMMYLVHCVLAIQHWLPQVVILCLQTCSWLDIASPH